MIADGLDVVVDVRIDVRLRLLVIDPALHDVKEMGDDTTRGKTMTDVIEIEAPGVGQTSSKDLKGFGHRVKAPDAGIDELPLLGRGARFADIGSGEDAMTAVEPTIRSPNEAVQGLVTIMRAPTI